VLQTRPTAAALVAAACRPDAPASSPDYLFLWTAAADSTQPDFLAVLDVTEDSVQYGALVTTVPVPGRGNGPHHTEHEMPADGLLFANGFPSGQTFIFDLTQPATPRLAGQFGDVGAYTHPHSFLRLPNGNVLATFQMQHDSGGMVAGGLVMETRDHETGYTLTRPLEKVSCHDILMTLRTARGERAESVEDNARKAIDELFEKVLLAEKAVSGGRDGVVSCNAEGKVRAE